MSDTEAVVVDGVTRRYGDVTALSNVSLRVERGESLGVVGTNGAGKTTLFRLLVGHERPDEGRVRVLSRDPAAGTAVRERVGYLPESAGFHHTLTGREVLEFHARQRSVEDVDRRVERVLRTVGLADAADRRVGGYSNGMGRRLGLATTLLADPELLLLDEPTAGLDPDGVAAFREVLSEIRAKTEVTVLLTSHVLSEIDTLCDRVAVLDDGAVATTGDVRELTRRHVDDVSIRLWLEPDADPDVAHTLGDLATVTVDAVSPDRVDLRCPRERAFEVLATAHDRFDVEGFEVDEDGLAATVRSVVDAPATGGDPA